MIVNIITVVFNDAKHIEETIQSVIQQQHKRSDLKINYFVIDGGSTDGTLEVLRKYNGEIHHWISESDKGIYDAMNKGLKMVHDGYVLFLGAGDKIISLIDPQLLPESKMNAFYGDVWIGDKLFTSHLNHRLKRGNTLHHQGLLIHRSLFPSHGFNAKYQAYADYDLNIKFLINKVNFIKASDLIGFQMPGGLTSKIHVMEMFEIIKNNFGTIEFYKLTIRYIFSEIKSKLLQKKSILYWGKI